ncbi:MAG: hypothetical protein MZW92_66260 [Comamonadaceae bacterium]|nr:hypothetical protein [Comamonadaceae bacterium]
MRQHPRADARLTNDRACLACELRWTRQHLRADARLMNDRASGLGPSRRGTDRALHRALEVEALVADLRARFDPRRPEGVPAHVTVLVPFLPLLEQIGAAVAARLEAALREMLRPSHSAWRAWSAFRRPACA